MAFVAAAPTAAAASAPCGNDYGSSGSIRVSTDSSCRVDVGVFEGIHCVGPWTGSVGVDTGVVSARVYYCDPLMGTTPRDVLDRVTEVIDLMIDASACEGGGARVPWVLRAELNEDCTAEVYAFEDIICAPPSSIWVKEEVGPVTVGAGMCNPLGNVVWT